MRRSSDQSGRRLPRRCADPPIRGLARSAPMRRSPSPHPLIKHGVFRGRRISGSADRRESAGRHSSAPIGGSADRRIGGSAQLWHIVRMADRQIGGLYRSADRRSAPCAPISGPYRAQLALALFPGECGEILIKSETLNDATGSPTYWRALSLSSQTPFFHHRPTYFRRSFFTLLAQVPLPPCPLFPFLYQLSSVVLIHLDAFIQYSCANTAVSLLNMCVAVFKTVKKSCWETLCECREQILGGLRKTKIS